MRALFDAGAGATVFLYASEVWALIGDSLSIGIVDPAALWRVPGPADGEWASGCLLPTYYIHNITYYLYTINFVQ